MQYLLTIAKHSPYAPFLGELNFIVGTQVRRPVPDNPHDHEPEAIADSDAGDPRDMLIISQALRIVRLEQRVRELEQCVCKLTKHEQVGDCDDLPQNATI